MKLLKQLTEADLEEYPVWCFVPPPSGSDSEGEWALSPKKKLPVRNLDGCVVACKAKLNSGDLIWVLLSNVNLTRPELNQYIVEISFLMNGEWFELARYHDFDASERGIKQLTQFLNKKIEDIYPISYDISQFCIGDHRSLVGNIRYEPDPYLTRDEVIALTVKLMT